MLATMHIGELVGHNFSGAGEAKTLVHLDESRGAFRVASSSITSSASFGEVNDNIDATSIPAGSPQVAVHMVQQRRGRVVKDLGTKMLHGRNGAGDLRSSSTTPSQ